MVKPQDAAICVGTVMHHRTKPTDHRFTYPVTYIWFDPDRPEELSDLSPLWSHRYPAVVQIRRGDYLDGGTEPMQNIVRGLVTEATGYRPDGEIRMLSQPRTWGWLFNPISIYLLWDHLGHSPVAAVLEVSNTPWKERHHYAFLLEAASDNTGFLTATFEKHLHVSPFLDQNCLYQLRLRGTDQTKLKVDINVVTPEGSTVLRTALSLTMRPATRQSLAETLRQNPFPTHRVSGAIHTQAARLGIKRVPFVPKPSKLKK